MRSEIIQLVLTLTPSERREFKIKHGTSSDFVKVLDYVYKSQSLDYAELRSYFEKNFPERKTNYTSGYFSSIVAYMQEKVAEIIVESERKRAYVEFARRLSRYYAFANRGLHQMAWNELATCKELAVNNHLYEEQLIVNRQEYIIHNLSRYENTSIEGLMNLRKESSAITQELELQYKYADVLSRISLSNYRETADDLEIHEAFDLSINDLETGNFWAAVMHKFSVANNLLATQRILDGFEQYEQLLAMWNKEKHLIYLRPRMFLIQVQFYFNWLLKLPEINEFGNPKQRASDLLTLLEVEIKAFTSKLDINFCNEIILIIQFWLLRKDKKYEEITQSISPEEISQYADIHNRIHLIYSVAFSYFQLNMSEKTLQLIEPIIEGDYTYKSNNHIFFRVLMLRILVYKEKKDDKYVLYLIQNARYLFKKYGFESDYEKTFLSLMQRMSGKTYQKNAQLILGNTKIELSKIIETKKDYLMLSEWIEKQILK